jgi:peroxiredoxin
VAVDPYVLPEGLPVPDDDGAAEHLPGKPIPALVLDSSAGPVDLAELCATLGVLYVYPRSGRPGEPLLPGWNEIPGARAGRPGEPLLPGWNEIPGARGCTPQSCGFRDHAAKLAALGAKVAGLSAQSLHDQIEFAERNAMPFPVVSDPELRLRAALGLPTFRTSGLELYKRMAIVARDGMIEKVFYPVFPPDRNAADVVAWLTATVNR